MSRNLLSDFSPGPLDKYRKNASFNWKQMKIFIDGEENIEYYEKIVEALKEYPFCQPTSTKTLDDERLLSMKRLLAFIKLNLFDLTKQNVVQRNFIAMDSSATIKFSAAYGLSLFTLKTLGTERHAKYLEDTWNGKIIGSFCLTEIGHGSNTKAMRTTATYDPKKQEFILNTPDFEAAKCWAANLGQVATYAIVYAQLYSPDGKCHGLHTFIVDIRDEHSLEPKPGLILGDMGAKLGLNGIDNGFMIFQNYRIPRENLLNKTGDVTPDGKYVTAMKDPSKKFGKSLGALSAGRVHVISVATVYFEKVITIAIRYAAVRKQFGPENQDELPILEYQLHQWRILPYLAACYVFRIFANFFTQKNYELNMGLLTDLNKKQQDRLGLEIHALSSSGKPVVSWVVRDGIQECREACGGHGYLKVSGISDARNDHDANTTYEGESHVLCQQTSNWLLKLWHKNFKKGKTVLHTPLNSIYYLSLANQILQTRFLADNVTDAVDPINIMNAYKWLVCYLLRESYEKLQSLQNAGEDTFTAKNNAQVFYLRTLSIVYIEHFMMQTVYDFIKTAKDETIRNVLKDLLSLYGAWSLDKHMSILYQGGYATGSRPASLIKEGILKLCTKIKPNAVSLVDVIAPHDFYMTSPLGMSDGQVYKHLENAFFANTDSFARPNWLGEVSSLMQERSKL